jgi:hypothetical protein
VTGSQLDTPPQNRLEELLASAVTGSSNGTQNRESDAQFLRELMKSELFVVGGVAPDGTVRLSSATFRGETVLPAFTSQARIEQAIPDGTPYVKLPAKGVLRSRPENVKVLINLGVWHGRELLPNEISQLLSGGIPGESAGHVQVPAGARFHIGLPAVYPQGLADALTRYFGARGDVERASLGWIHLPDSEEPPHPVVGILPRAGSTLPDIVAHIDPVVRVAYAGPVDFVPLDAGDPIGGWLVGNTKPFFELQ